MTATAIRPIFPLTVLVIGLAVFISGQAAHGAESDRPQKRRVAVRGHLLGTPDTQQVITWQTENPSYGSSRYLQAHLAIETVGPDRRTLWQVDGSDLYHLVDSIRLADLDGDGVPEITSLWWGEPSSGGTLRVFHWNKDGRSFAEVSAKEDLSGIHSYQIVGKPAGPSKAARRLVTYVLSGSGANPVIDGEYEMVDRAIVRVGRRVVRQK